ncbi:MAG TPA: hypothetical protein VGM20_13170 [Gemmatimonadales bacterium]
MSNRPLNRVILGAMAGRDVDEIRRALRSTLPKHGVALTPRDSALSPADSAATVLIEMQEVASSTSDYANAPCTGGATRTCAPTRSRTTVTLSADVSLTVLGGDRRGLHQSVTESSSGWSTSESSGGGMTYTSTSSTAPLMLNVAAALADDVRRMIQQLAR